MRLENCFVKRYAEVVVNKFIRNWKLKIGNSLRSRVGFTQIELLLSMGILMILIGVLTTLFGQILDVQLESKAISSVDENGRYIMARLTHDMQSAQAIVTPENAGDQTNALQITVNSINYTYSLNNGNLQLTDNIGSDNLNSTAASISNLSFRRIGSSGNSDTVQVGFTVTSNTKQAKGSEQKNFQTTLGLN
jgi:Tfp pilus assembly protein PilW